MNPNNQLKTPAGYNGRTSATGYDLSFEFATRGIIRGFTPEIVADTQVKISSSPYESALAIASDGKEKAAIFMKPNEAFNVSVQRLQGSVWHVIIAIVKATPTGVSTEADNPSSVGYFEIPATNGPLTDEEIAEHVATSPSLGDFQGGKWVRLCNAQSINGALEQELKGPSAISSLPSEPIIADNSIASQKINWDSIKLSAPILIGQDFANGTVKTMDHFGLLQASTRTAFDNTLTLVDDETGYVLWQSQPRPNEGWATDYMCITVYKGQKLRFERTVESVNVVWNKVYLRKFE